MKQPDNPEDQIPWGLPRTVIAAAYFVVISLTGMAVQAADPLQEMMKLNGAYSDIQNENQRSGHIASVVLFGISCSVLSGIAVGPTLDFFGAKITGLVGLMLHTLGYVLMFFNSIPGLYYVSGACFGGGFQLILNAHLSAACLFPRNANLILTFLSAGADVSLFFPYGIKRFAISSGATPDAVRKVVLQYLIACVGGAAIIDALLLPMKQYSRAVVDENPEQKLLMSEDIESEKIVTAAKKPLVTPSYWKLSLMNQLMTLDYWLFIVILIFTFCRKKHFSVMIRPVIAEMDSDPSKATSNQYVDNYNLILPWGFIPAIIWGAVVDHFGINISMFASNALGTIFVAFSLVPILQVQIATIAIFIIYQSFVMGQALAFTASVYGMTTVATLQGVCCTITGVFSCLMDYYWTDFIYNTLGSFRVAGYIWLGSSVALFIFPAILTFLANRRSVQEELEMYESDDLFTTVMPPSQIFDRPSLGVLSVRGSRSSR